MNIVVRVYVLILLSVAVLLPAGIHAQTVCDEDKGITTNPDAAVNTEKPHKRNSDPVIFDWRDETFNMKVDKTLTSLVRIESPFWNGDVPIHQKHLADNKDYRPIDGWELIAQRFGKPYDALDDSFQDPVDRPMLILYNRLSGVMRVLIAPMKDDDKQFVKITLKHEKIGQGGVPSTLDMAESSVEKPLRALDDFDGDPTFVSVAPYVNSVLQFTYADFPMVYDPCTCGYPSRMYLTLDLIKVVTITMDGVSRREVVDIDELAQYTVLTPGSSEPVGIMQPEAIDDEYPYYNEPLGLFNLVETPKVAQYRGDVDPQFWRRNECGGGSTHPIITGDDSNFDPCRDIDTIGFDTLMFKLENVPDFAVNFAAGFDRNEYEILGSLVFENPEPLIGRGLGFLDPLSNSTEVVDSRRVRTRFVPLGCLPETPLRFRRGSLCAPGTQSDFGPICNGRVYLNLAVRLKRTEPSTSSTTVAFERTFPVSLAQVNQQPDAYWETANACTTAAAPISVSALQRFCGSNRYRQSRGFNKEALDDAGPVAGYPVDVHLTVRPNPASDYVAVRCSHRSTSEVVFALYDTFGGLVQTRTVPADRERNPEVRFDTSLLSSGTYIVVMSTGVTTLSSSIVVFR
jgi:hypothetical protein